MAQDLIARRFPGGSLIACNRRFADGCVAKSSNRLLFSALATCSKILEIPTGPQNETV
jgi:hypothetical protein